jgi:hypothetical protein
MIWHTHFSHFPGKKCLMLWKWRYWEMDRKTSYCDNSILGLSTEMVTDCTPTPYFPMSCKHHSNNNVSSVARVFWTSQKMVATSHVMIHVHWCLCIQQKFPNIMKNLFKMIERNRIVHDGLEIPASFYCQSEILTG